MRRSNDGSSETRSERPVPRLSNVATRAKLARRRSHRAKSGWALGLDVRHEARYKDQINWPAAKNLVSDMNVATFGIARHWQRHRTLTKLHADRLARAQQRSRVDS